MKRRLAAAAMLALGLLSVLPAAALAGNRGGGWLQVRERPQREHSQRFERFDRGERQAQPRRRDDEQRPQRMTPDERRELRRELRDAGRDIYPNRRDRRR